MGESYLKNEAEVDDFVRGCTFFGTGGGGPAEVGKEQLMAEFKKGRKVGWVDIERISDTDLTVCPYAMGSIAPRTVEVEKEMQKFGLGKERLTPTEAGVKAIKLLEKYTGKKVAVVVSDELGGISTPLDVAIASAYGLLCVDGDYVGRAIPEIPQLVPPAIYDKPLCPLVEVDYYGDAGVFDDAINAAVAERIGKLFTVAVFGLASCAGLLLSGAEMKKCVIPNTLTECLTVGSAIREARESGKDPASEVIKLLEDAWILFKGRVVGKETEDKEGYYWGVHTISGEGEFAGHKFKIWFKNENHISWLDGKPYVTSPDMLMTIDSKSGEPKTNSSIKEGDNLTVIGVKAREQYRSKKGIDILGPAHFGFEDIQYTPIEKIIK
jgi:hypothetical protein